MALSSPFLFLPWSVRFKGTTAVAMPSAAWAQFRFGLSLAIFISLPTWSGGGGRTARGREVMQTVSVGRAWAGWRVNRCVPQSTTKCCLKSSEFSKRGENLSINDACMCTCVCVCVSCKWCNLGIRIVLWPYRRDHTLGNCLV